jgi:O-antigen/teichoic acid export membrane protein
MLASISPQEWLRAEWDFSPLKRLGFLVLPLGFVAVLASLNSNIPRYFIEHYWGEQALGYFAAAAYLQMAGNTFVIALGQSAVPRLARDYHSSRSAFRLLVQQMILIAACIGGGGVLVAVVFGRPLLELLYRPDYAQYKRVFVSLMLAGALNYIVSVLCAAMTASRMFRPQAVLFVITTISKGRFQSPLFDCGK